LIRQDEVYSIGVIGKVHGIKGEVTFNFDDDVFDRVDADYVVIDIDGILVPFFFEEYRFKNDSVAIVKFEGIDDTNKAQLLTGKKVFFPKELSDEDDVLRWSDLKGYTINTYDKDDKETTVGRIEYVDETTENVLFGVIDAKGEEVLIPAADDFIKDIDHDRQTISMMLPEGLIE